MLMLIRSGFVIIVFLIVLNVLTIFITMLTYTRLSDEVEVARITFDYNSESPSKSKLEYTAVLTEPDGDTSEYTIYGDQWQLDAKFIKFFYWANILGLDARYQLDRLSGRYQSIEDQNNNKKLSHDLTGIGILDPFDLILDNEFIFFFLDAEYGSSTYQDINVDKTYVIYRTQTGLISRAELRAPPSEEEGIIDSILNWATE